MRQFTTPEQIAKLIELGFEKPRSIEKVTFTEKYGCGFEAAYSISELIEMLPEELNDGLKSRLGIYIDHNKMWAVDYCNVLGELYSTYRTELIDALYNMIVKLKEDKIL